MINWKNAWSGFHQVYGPALVGGIFLCIADLMQSDRHGQICKVGDMIKRHFLNGQLAEARKAVLGAPALAAQALAVIAADGEFASDCKALAADLRAKLGK